ncbi:DUF429 domain-containing protein [Xanthobacteraceae bacterium Astr-EGSB]|uniref:DUF429 domain-containing protein n=1 Tax=Astrobacterium formosum TaxID=3069710 RepID=UPI0027B4EADD|nr:DUF429 domain-containing protein [Xanthobacteraceae bacterium Astr-EGSB]
MSQGRSNDPVRGSNRPPAFLGLDVGFAADRETTGIAWRVCGQIGVAVAGTQWESRQAALPPDVRFDLAAVDAPILPASAEAELPRACEAVLCRRPFWNRCKPGRSHHGLGLEFRRAGAAAGVQIPAVLQRTLLPYGPMVLSNLPVVEAFPNGFLGVMLSDQVFEAGLKLRRGERFDWLYDRALATGCLSRVLLDLSWGDDRALREVEADHDTRARHEMRAALVCLLTAGFAHAGSATVLGDPGSGWFWLPPTTLWAEWARRGLDEAIACSRVRGFPQACTWRPLDL